MSFLASISERFRLDAHQPPSSGDEISRLVEFSQISVPEDYLTLIREGTELEFAVDNRGHIRIWGASGCVEMNEAYHVNGYNPSSLAIGDNEAGAALILIENITRPGLYLIGFGCLALEEGKFIAPSITDLLVNEVGIESLD